MREGEKILLQHFASRRVQRHLAIFVALPNDFEQAAPLAQFYLVTPEAANFSCPQSRVQQEDNEDAVPEVSCARHRCDERLFFLIVPMARSTLLLSNEFDGGGRIVWDDVSL